MVRLRVLENASYAGSALTRPACGTPLENPVKKSFSIPQAQSSAMPFFKPDAPWLAPLAGYSDLPFRLLCREHGAAVCETEMISAKGLLYGSSGTTRLLHSTPADTPLVAQLFGGEPESMGEALLTLRRHGYTAFDCNMGCPVRKVMRQKAGSALMADPGLAIAIAKAMLKAAAATGPGLPETTPAMVGFKLRLGPNAQCSALDLGRKLEDMGAGWLCLHPRTASDGFGGHARWQETARLVEAVRIPVIASGDLHEAADGIACLAQTGAATVMYARGALRNPLIFSQHKAIRAGGSPAAPDHAATLALIRRHIELTRQTDGTGQAFRKIRSIIPRYGRRLAGVSQLRQALSVCESWEALEEALIKFWERGEKAQ